MDSILGFFSDIPPAYRTVFLVGGLAVFWMLEVAWPLFRFDYRKVRHAMLNVVFWATTLAIALAFAALIVGAAVFVEDTQVGLLNAVDLPIWADVVLGLLLLDLIGAYFIHWLEHKVRWMWKFHLIHHTDREVDVTTGLRHHPGEAVFRSAFTVLAVVVSGASVGVVFLYQSLSAFFAQITHANVSSPERLDRWLSWIFVTPNMHKVHHHFMQPLTDTNYGNMFSIWDRLFGTFAEVEHARDLVYGIDTHMAPEEHSGMGNLLAMPFQPYRPPRGSKFGGDRPDGSIDLSGL